MISRFYGLFKIQHNETTTYLLVMPNVFKDLKVGLIFDLKGSTASRNSLKGDQKPSDLPGIPLKDNDFTNHVGNLKFYENDKTQMLIKHTSLVDIKQKVGTNAK